MNSNCVHCFSHDETFLVVDGNSGSVHLVDELVFDLVSILQQNPGADVDALAHRFDGKYSRASVQEAWAEIQDLRRSAMLFVEDDTTINVTPPTAVKALCLNVAHDCDLRCQYCFAGKGGFGGSRGLMPDSTARAAVDFLLDASADRKQLEVDFFGGEPLLNFGVVKRTVEYAKEAASRRGKNVRFTLTTNGMRLNKDITEFLNREMYNVVLSLDGRRAVNDKVRQTVNGQGSVYDTVVPKFRTLVRDRTASYYVRGTFTADNLDFFHDVLHMTELGFSQVSVEPVSLDPGNPLALTDRHLPAIFEQYEILADALVQRTRKGQGFSFFHFNVELKKGPCLYKRLSGCGAGFEYVAAAPDGRLYPCHQFVGDDAYVLGHVSTGLRNEKLAHRFRNAHVLNKPVCQGCWAKYFCSGGCHASNVRYAGSLHEPHELSCAMERKRLECALYLQARLHATSTAV